MSKKKKELTATQWRAVGLLSQGMNLSEAADRCNVCRATLHRWKNSPNFKASLEKNVNETMGASIQQIQNTARNLIEGGLEAARELRFLVLNERSPAHVRRLAANDILRYEQRWLDILGFNAKSRNPRKLIDEEYDEEAEALPERVPDEKDCTDGDGDQRPIEQLTPESPLVNRHGPPSIAEVWKLDPLEEPEPGTWAAQDLQREKARVETKTAAATETAAVVTDVSPTPEPEPEAPAKTDTQPEPEEVGAPPTPAPAITPESEPDQPCGSRPCTGRCRQTSKPCRPGSTCDRNCATDQPSDNGQSDVAEESTPIRDD